MIHKIYGHNFHGNYSVRVRMPADGGVLSAKQVRKISRSMCDYDGCRCGGGYGDGPHEGSARMVQVDFDKFVLVPAGDASSEIVDDLMAAWVPAGGAK